MSTELNTVNYENEQQVFKHETRTHRRSSTQPIVKSQATHARRFLSGPCLENSYDQKNDVSHQQNLFRQSSLPILFDKLKSFRKSKCAIHRQGMMSIELTEFQNQQVY
eukprot:TRINITY_DN925_c0_g1_i10.p5 TRINITY_DN925_c0_g1~~TRINITY_DN925_c0_g1_i10.p5  ORF type:complete len:108 (-),score=0.08 TRINITY_DN925_c0_g1_i10:525-848(-)